MRSPPTVDRCPRNHFPRLRLAAAELRVLGLDLVFYVGVLTLLVIGAVTMWNGLPDAVAQARDIATTAGWRIEPPPLRGSL